jgi:Ca2+-binding EF-hand superfamily protein
MHARLHAFTLATVIAGVGFIATDASAARQGQGQARGRYQNEARTERQMRFQAMDVDNDGVITRAEWRGNLQAFRRHDRNGDNVLSGDEVRLIQDTPETNLELSAVFERADRNNDRVLARNEWYGDLQTFERVDRNDDGRISLPEFLGEDVAATTGLRRRGFAQLDTNGNGVITRNEWIDSRDEFEALDDDNDGAITRAEFRNSENQSEAFRAGYNRGMTEGRQAGYEDKNVNGGRWDLDGQRELEQADSGYTTAIGSRSEYQSGYRAGFRRGYALGFGPR